MVETVSRAGVGQLQCLSQCLFCAFPPLNVQGEISIALSGMLLRQVVRMNLMIIESNRLPSSEPRVIVCTRL